jgi:hypothetical protein
MGKTVLSLVGHLVELWVLCGFMGGWTVLFITGSITAGDMCGFILRGPICWPGVALVYWVKRRKALRSSQDGDK